RYFFAHLPPTYFPSIGDFRRIDQLLARDLDADALFSRTRLAGAPAPVLYSDPRSDESNDYYWKLIRSAERAAKVRNEVRAAILRTPAARVAPAALTHSTRAAGHADLQRLTQRLRVALKLNDEQAAAWQNDLLSLLDKADQGFRTVEARLLYDLQTA